MIMQKCDENRQQAMIQCPHGNHTKRHALTMETELVREYIERSAGAGDGLCVFQVMQTCQQQLIGK